eukprot:4388649-Karenia_brevis.AAC.1
MIHTITIPSGFNTTVLVCPPKKPQHFDSEGAWCTPEATRPIGKQNTDNKIISKSQNHAVYPILQQYASHIQRGFIPQRYFLSNVIELDAFAHKWSFPVSREFLQRPGVLAFFDFSKAFPSIAVRWILFVLRRYRAPLGLYNYVLCTYIDLITYVQYK